MIKDVNRISRFVRLIPGVALCCAVAAAAVAAEHAEARLAGRPWLETLVLAIILGTVVRTLWIVPARFGEGIQFTTKVFLEFAVLLMGASISFGAIRSAGAPLLLGIIATVFASIVVSYALGLALGLPTKMALLVACGNSICGNSAIAAVAPVIDAESDDVATAIAFTAVLGILVVLLLPVIASALHLSPTASGVLAGLTVYAVPQVLAAAAPMGSVAVQVGTVVKLVRVLMLGPVVTAVSLTNMRNTNVGLSKPRLSLLRFFPAFILGFLALATARSAGLLPEAMLEPMHTAASSMTVVAMAGLGLGVDMRQVKAAGPRVSLVVVLSLMLLTALAFLVLHLLGMA
ncbi:YeiH family protein [Roseateles chitinivorans]|uniref:YeiH family protein n=1 Tax=Roseateles chitinivorans TaxID=2917965 RepID=UPI003D669E9E